MNFWCFQLCGDQGWKGVEYLNSKKYPHDLSYRMRSPHVTQITHRIEDEKKPKKSPSIENLTRHLLQIILNQTNKQKKILDFSIHVTINMIFYLWCHPHPHHHHRLSVGTYSIFTYIEILYHRLVFFININLKKMETADKPQILFPPFFTM